MRVTSERGAIMVSDRDIAEALDSLLRETNHCTTFSSVVQQLESKLGLDLTHKVDFIHNQIRLLFGSNPQPPPPPPPPSHHQHHLFQSHQNPNFLTTPSQVGFRPPQPPVATNTEPYVADVSTSVAATAPGVPAEAPKESSQTGRKRRGGPGGLNKVCGVSPELQAIVGQPELARTEIVKQLWVYIKKNNLQDPTNKRKIICNDELRLVFETDSTDMFYMNKLLSKHIIPLEPAKPVHQSSKKPKIEVESRAKSAESGPVVIISDALANFFGTGGREMLHSEVLRRVWEYVGAKQLEDPLNSMVIRCDANFQELFGCATISALGIPEMLARHHLFKRS